MALKSTGHLYPGQVLGIRMALCGLRRLRLLNRLTARAAVCTALAAAKGSTTGANGA